MHMVTFGDCGWGPRIVANCCPVDVLVPFKGDSELATIDLFSVEALPLILPK